MGGEGGSGTKKEKGGLFSTDLYCSLFNCKFYFSSVVDKKPGSEFAHC
jgi:hypothetical protein